MIARVVKIIIQDLKPRGSDTQCSVASKTHSLIHRYMCTQTCSADIPSVLTVGKKIEFRQHVIISLDKPKYNIFFFKWNKTRAETTTTHEKCETTERT